MSALSLQEIKLLHYLSGFVSEHKKNLIEKVLGERTRHVTVVLEDVYQSQNASAVVRTCECLGVQDVHIIENISTYQINKYVLRGSQKWMNIIRYHDKSLNNTEQCLTHLRNNGYRIFATSPNSEAISIQDIDIQSSKVALVFGNELRGVSQEMLRMVDGSVTIPMYGFTESYNLSVSVAICLSAVIEKLRNTTLDFGLTSDERHELLLTWYRKIVRNSHLLEREFMRTIE